MYHLECGWGRHDSNAVFLSGTVKWVNWDLLEVEAIKSWKFSIALAKLKKNPVYFEVYLSYMGGSGFDN